MDANVHWPSLYSPGLEIHNIQHRPPTQPGGRYLYSPHKVFLFTLYWTFIFYIPPFVLCGAYAFLNITIPPTRRPSAFAFSSLALKRVLSPRSTTTVPAADADAYPGTAAESVPMLPAPPPPPTRAQSRFARKRRRLKPNEGRSRATFGLLVLFGYLACALGGAVISSAVGAYILVGLFKAAKYNMSTWIPLIWALIQSLVGLLGIWPSVIDIT